MDDDELIDRLTSLMHLDFDAVHVYDEALRHAEDREVRARFERFQGEHRYHAEQLAETIKRITGTKPRMKVDLLGHMAEWVTALRSVSGTQGALHAMRTAEKYHNRRYEEAVRWDVGDRDIAKMLQRFLGDERRHLEYVQSKVAEPVGAGR